MDFAPYFWNERDGEETLVAPAEEYPCLYCFRTE